VAIRGSRGSRHQASESIRRAAHSPHACHSESICQQVVRRGAPALGQDRLYNTRLKHLPHAATHSKKKTATTSKIVPRIIVQPLGTRILAAAWLFDPPKATRALHDGACLILLETTFRSAEKVHKPTGDNAIGTYSKKSP
jgi:hypothetical protein